MQHTLSTGLSLRPALIVARSSLRHAPRLQSVSVLRAAYIVLSPPQQCLHVNKQGLVVCNVVSQQLLLRRQRQHAIYIHFTHAVKVQRPTQLVRADHDDDDDDDPQTAS